MKLLQINAVYSNGSTGKICKQIDTDFREKHLGESKIAYFWGQKASESNAVKCADDKYAKAMAIKSRVTGKYGFVSQKATKSVLNLINEYKPDIIHLHNIHDHTIDLSMLFEYLRYNKAKIVWTFHDCWSYTGYCSYYQLSNCYKWMKSCGDCPIAHKYSWFIDKSKWLYEQKKKLYGNMKLEIITPSAWLANETKKSFLASNNITVINNGVNLDVFRPIYSDFKKKYDIENKKIILGVAYQWEERKGIDMFLQLSKIISSGYVIVLVGTMLNKYSKLPNNIISISRTNNQKELAEIYTAADVFVNPTREENFPLVNLESLACGTPVVTFNTGGSPECIDYTCGIVCANEDVETLYDCIKQVCEDKYIEKDACLRRANELSVSKMCDGYLDKYIEIMQGDKC